jgi:hypothetical protein
MPTCRICASSSKHHAITSSPQPASRKTCSAGSDDGADETVGLAHATQLPEPYSDDPTQWLFHGHPAQAEKGATLHVALARLCGYRWPAESDEKMRLSQEARAWIAKAAALPQGDDDGLLALPAVAGERPLAERLRTYLAAAFRVEWSDGLERASSPRRTRFSTNVPRAIPPWKPGSATAPSASIARCSITARSFGMCGTGSGTGLPRSFTTIASTVPPSKS